MVDTRSEALKNFRTLQVAPDLAAKLALTNYYSKYSPFEISTGQGLIVNKSLNNNLFWGILTTD